MHPSPSLAPVAFVLGAGLGTRLRPLTEERPKPLIPVANKPLITYAFDRLIDIGIRAFVVNTHHAPEAFWSAFPDGRYRGREIQFRHEPLLLDTAGGVRNVADLFGNQPFLIHNGDVLTDLPIDRAVERHLAGGDLATLVLRSNGPALHVAFDPESGRVIDIRNRLGTNQMRQFLYTGIAVLSPGILSWIPKEGPVSLISVFLEILQSCGRIGGILLDEGIWFDLGTRQSYLAVHRHLWAEPGSFRSIRWVDPTARIEPGAVLEGATAIGARCWIGAGALLKNSIVWEGAEVAAQSRLENCIVRNSRLAKGNLADSDI
ncbi:mannose-1-phosphate guanylyltransferase [Methylacidimicrobium cyclopophantes]|uniref:Mannose-1-phosphate guanylyltransferase n=1 Tax=Methylacidimicrobium cyclopophantes TaxID=1041766 RepID=A0A5E6MCR2_9BACT|nr:sugar phosphate nucleotidyltransferase [Methylacidimicrobium cyclopophantes]VVM05571.1 mannose-1-phosphate guanylyltransferase [Methylacidimicrobium cyclopophantes]